jgi:hypothetical protein
MKFGPPSSSRPPAPSHCFAPLPLYRSTVRPFYRWTLLAFLFCATAWACRYSVRDVAFVDLENEPYELVCVVDERTPPAYLEALRVTALSLFFDANVRLEIVNLQTDSRHPAATILNQQTSRVVPRGILVAPGTLLPRSAESAHGARGMSLPQPWHPIELPPVEESDPEAFWPRLEAVVSSPKREALLRRLTEAFAILVLVEGTVPEQTARARRAAQGAISEITRLLPRMPKPVRTPPDLLVITPGEAASESVWLWSLGLETEDLSEPQIAVLHGRGRRLGPALSGGLITQTALREMLAVNGQDCECELDRSWMRGPIIPSSWGEELQKLSFNELGFDPENPLVKTEISRILSRGPSASGGGLPASATFDQMLLGYKEELSGHDSTESAAASEPNSEGLLGAERAGNISSVAPLEKEGEPSGRAAVPLVKTALVAALGLAGVALLGGGWILIRSRRNL